MRLEQLIKAIHSAEYECRANEKLLIKVSDLAELKREVISLREQLKKSKCDYNIIDAKLNLCQLEKSRSIDAYV